MIPPEFEFVFCFEAVPHAIGSLANLRELDLSETAITRLPDVLRKLQALEELLLGGCRSLQNLPASVGGLSSLRNLELQYCSTLQFLPESLGELKKLKKLGLLGCWQLQRLPASLEDLGALEALWLYDCRSLQGESCACARTSCILSHAS